MRLADADYNEKVKCLCGGDCGCGDSVQGPVAAPPTELGSPCTER